MNYPIKGTFQSFKDYIKIKGHGDKELDPNQIQRIETEDRVLYLTFDTCPTSEVDTEMVEWLIDNKIPATIFLNVEWFTKNRDKDLSFLKSKQFSIGGHGFKHIRPLRQTESEQEADIHKCINFIKIELDRDVKWYRSPYGKPNEDTINILTELGIQFASWAGHVFDKTDPDLPNPNELSLNYAKRYTRPGDIWIFHINGEGINSLKTLKDIYEWAISNKYQFKKL